MIVWPTIQATKYAPYYRPQTNDVRNKLNSNLPQNPKQAEAQGYTRESREILHQQTNSKQGQAATNNKKYISSDGKKEVVYNNGKIVNDPVNRGTYNFKSPKNDPIGHVFADVIPYYIHGTGKDDPSNFGNRVAATFGANKGKNTTQNTSNGRAGSKGTSNTTNNNNVRGRSTSNTTRSSNVRSGSGTTSGAARKALR